MIIHWEWLPLIITIITCLLAYIFEKDQDLGLFSLLSGFCGLYSIIIYIILGIKWLYNNIQII